MALETPAVSCPEAEGARVVPIGTGWFKFGYLARGTAGADERAHRADERGRRRGPGAGLDEEQEAIRRYRL